MVLKLKTVNENGVWLGKRELFRLFCNMLYYITKKSLKFVLLTSVGAT